jgi:sugar lactone lactonase YvrE
MRSHLLNHILQGATAIAAAAWLIGSPTVAPAQPSQILIDDTRVFPESLTSTANGTIIIGSLDHGTVYRVAPGAAKATPWIAAPSDGLVRVLGVFANDASHVLFLCANDPDPAVNKAELKTFDLETGAPKSSFPFPGGGLCNDIAVAPDGTAFVTDTRGGRILTLKPGAASLNVWGADDKWKGIDGIVVLGNAVLFNNVRENQLARVEMKPDGSAGAVTFLEPSQPIEAPDGMRTLPDGRIVMAENRGGKIDFVSIDGGKAKIDTIKDGFKLSPTAVTVVGDTVWVLEAKFAYRNDPALKDKDPGPFGATAVPLPAR